MCVNQISNSLNTQLNKLIHKMETAATTATNSSFPRSSASDNEEAYATVSSLPPKRRAGRTKFRETQHPIYKGVRRRNSDRWVCEVHEPNKKSRIWLGTFPPAEMAARAHDVAAIALRGRSACLNFADSAWLLPVPDSSSPRDIQRTAAIAAEAFWPPSSKINDSADDHIIAVNQTATAGNDTNVVDDDLLFVEDGSNLGMLDYFDMAQGMLIDPPPAAMVPDDVDGESDGEMSLWSYSI